MYFLCCECRWRKQRTTLQCQWELSQWSISLSLWSVVWHRRLSRRKLQAKLEVGSCVRQVAPPFNKQIHSFYTWAWNPALFSFYTSYDYTWCTSVSLIRMKEKKDNIKWFCSFALPLLKNKPMNSYDDVRLFLLYVWQWNDDFCPCEVPAWIFFVGAPKVFGVIVLLPASYSGQVKAKLG